MAYSIFATLSPEVLESPSEGLSRIFEDSPWLKEVQDGEILIWTKPRFETHGEKRAEAFFEILKAESKHLIAITEDSPGHQKTLSFVEKFGLNSFYKGIY